LFALEQVQKNGGCLEHPYASKLWKHPDILKTGFIISVDQFDFGHTAHKPTKIYICGIDKQQMPALPEKSKLTAEKSITGQVPGTKRCTNYERIYTPQKMCEWLIKIALLI
jgi:hypothetical protein